MKTILFRPNIEKEKKIKKLKITKIKKRKLRKLLTKKAVLKIEFQKLNSKFSVFSIYWP